MKRMNKKMILGISLALLVFLSAQSASAFSIIPKLPDTSSTSAFTQTINAGTLTVDIVDASYVTVAAPSVALGAVTFSFACQTSTGVFGTASEVIYVKNPDAADGGWVVSLAASSPAAVWTSSVSFDFNDPTGAGCTDGADAGDLRGGQMTVDPSAGTLATGACLSCTTTGITKGSSAAFSETGSILNSITILTAAAGSNDIGDWRLTGVGVSQTLPAEQRAASDYTISLVLTII